MFFKYISLKDQKNNPEAHKFLKNEKMQNIRAPKIQLRSQIISLEHLHSQKWYSKPPIVKIELKQRVIGTVRENGKYFQCSSSKKTWAITRKWCNNLS